MRWLDIKTLVRIVLMALLFAPEGTAKWRIWSSSSFVYTVFGTVVYYVYQVELLQFIYAVISGRVDRRRGVMVRNDTGRVLEIPLAVQPADNVDEILATQGGANFSVRIRNGMVVAEIITVELEEGNANGGGEEGGDAAPGDTGAGAGAGAPGAADGAAPAPAGEGGAGNVGAEAGEGLILGFNAGNEDPLVLPNRIPTPGVRAGVATDAAAFSWALVASLLPNWHPVADAGREGAPGGPPAPANAAGVAAAQ